MMSSKRIQEAVNGLIDARAVMDKFGVSASAVYHWYTARSMPYVAIPGSDRAAIRFVPEEVDKWVEDEGVKGSEGKAAAAKSTKANGTKPKAKAAASARSTAHAKPATAPRSRARLKATA